jgi:hypothetical protein
MESKEKPPQKIGEYWALMDGDKKLFGFSTSAHGQVQGMAALEVIKTYGFTKLYSAGEFIYWQK